MQIVSCSQNMSILVFLLFPFRHLDFPSSSCIILFPLLYCLPYPSFSWKNKKKKKSKYLLMVHSNAACKALMWWWWHQQVMQKSQCFWAPGPFPLLVGWLWGRAFAPHSSRIFLSCYAPDIWSMWGYIVFTFVCSFVGLFVHVFVL